MAEIVVSEEGAVAATPDRVYSYIANYRDHHPRFLPPAFSDLRIDQGGIGEGTVISFTLNAGGRKRSYRMKVSEPEPGSVLAESDELSSLVTTFTVSPQGDSSLVRIQTRWQGSSGIGGFMERTFAPRVIKRLYADELQRLDAYARQQVADV